MKTFLIHVLILIATTCQAEDKPKQVAKEVTAINQQLLAEANVLKSLGKVEASLEIGVNYSDFGKLLIDAKAAINEEGKKLPIGSRKEVLIQVMQAYQDAHSLWGDEVAQRERNLGERDYQREFDKRLLDTYFSEAKPPIDIRVAKSRLLVFGAACIKYVREIHETEKELIAKGDTQEILAWLKIRAKAETEWIKQQAAMTKAKEEKLAKIEEQKIAAEKAQKVAAEKAAAAEKEKAEREAVMQAKKAVLRKIQVPTGVTGVKVYDSFPEEDRPWLIRDWESERDNMMRIIKGNRDGLNTVKGVDKTNRQREINKYNAALNRHLKNNPPYIAK